MKMWPRAATGSRAVAVLVLLCLVVEGAHCEEDLYRVLGVARSATAREIRSAHKRMAKEWHPDKNKSPEAHERIMEINRAYEILSDDEKRQRYDLTGETGESPQARAQPQGHTVFTFHNGRSFHFFTGGGSTHRSDAITTPTFFNEVLPNSHRKPYLLTFHHEFCMQCAQLEQVWRELRNELSQLGVGVASVHSTTQPRIATHCGASQVPAVVGVVSGRVIHYHGRWGGTATFKTFLENILPTTVTELSGSTDPDDFLSQAVPRNRPRVVLFSPRESPSLLFKLTAFAHQSTVDFAYVSTNPVHLGPAVSQRFGVLPREKRLLVFKEFPDQPALSVEGNQLSSERLRSVVGTLSLHLPRLSSPLWLDRVCPPATNRPCLLLLVKETSAYNDEATDAFRWLARDSDSAAGLGWGYVDTAKQAGFLQSFGPLPADLKQCPDGSLAKLVIAMKRSSSHNFVFDWFPGFCGREEDGRRLLSLASTPRFSRSGVLLPLLDEEAPGWLGRMWNRVTQFLYDLSDFISAVDSHMITPLITLSVTALLICLVGGLSGSTEDHQDNKRIKKTGHSPHKSSPSSREDVVYKLNHKKYSDFIQNAPKGLVTLVVFVDSYKQEESQNLIHSFWNVAQRFLSRRTRVCYVCYKTHGLWLSHILKAPGEFTSKEYDTIIGGCFAGKAMTLLAIFGAKKQFCMFSSSVRSRSSSPSVPNGSAKHPHLNLSTGNSVAQQRVEHRGVGDILGSAFGFEANISESSSVNTPSKGNFLHAQHSTSAATSDFMTSRAPSSENSSQSDCDSETSDASTQFTAGSHDILGHTTDPSSSHHKVRSQLLAEQLETWMERLVDGSLKRYSVDKWPEWS